MTFFRGTADFFGLNHYSSKIVEPAPKGNKTIYEDDVGLLYSYDPKWPSTPTEALKVSMITVIKIVINILLKLSNTY